MPLRVANNIAAINTGHQLNANHKDLKLRLERLSSGLRVNSAADDAAGLSIRESMRAQISGLKMNVKNAEQGSNMLQVAEGSLNEVNAMLIRMRELAVQSSNSTYTLDNRTSNNAEYTQIVQEIDRIARSTKYNDQNLLTGFGKTYDEDASTAVVQSPDSGLINIRISHAAAGTFTFEDSADDSQVTLGNGTITQTLSIGTMLDGDQVGEGRTVVFDFDRIGIQITMAGENVEGNDDGGNYVDGGLDTHTIEIEDSTGGSFQVGPNAGIDNQFEVSMPDMSASGNQLSLDLTNVSTQENARSAITQIDEAITKVAAQRGDLGAWMNRLAFTVSFTQNSIENMTASEASISDADIADEVSHFTKSQILSQTATAMLAHAMVVPQTALTLLQ